MQTTKDTFEKQIKGLKDFGYNFITYDQLQKYKNNEIKLKKKSCIVTFDDGLEGVYKNAYPIAQKYNIPFTMFVIINSMEKEGCITWNEAKESLSYHGHCVLLHCRRRTGCIAGDADHTCG